MIDESMDKEAMKLPPAPHEFRSKPAWQRLIIMVGGVTVNLILGILIYAMVLFAWGETYLPNENAKYGIHCDSLAMSMGLKNGDKILAVDNNKIDNFDKIVGEMILNLATTVTVQRGDSVFNLPIPERIYAYLIKGKASFIQARTPAYADTVIANSIAEKAGIKNGDRIISINDSPITFFDEASKIVTENKDKEITVTLLRGEKDTLVKTVKVSVEGKIGFGPFTENHFETVHNSYGFFASFPAGLKKGYNTCVNYVKQMKILFVVEDAHQSLGGFITIAKGYGDVWNWQRFWSFTAFISIVLAIMNILPIPALDGGHIMFLTWELITRRKANEKVLEYAQYTGMILLLALLLYANGNDIVRLFTGG